MLNKRSAFIPSEFVRRGVFTVYSLKYLYHRLSGSKLRHHYAIFLLKMSLSQQNSTENKATYQLLR